MLIFVGIVTAPKKQDPCPDYESMLDSKMNVVWKCMEVANLNEGCILTPEFVEQIQILQEEVDKCKGSNLEVE